MSERITEDWALYEVASNMPLWEHFCHVYFNIEEQQRLQEYLQVYKKYLNLIHQIRNLEESLPPHPQINEVTKKYQILKEEESHVEAEIQRLVKTTPLQNILNYRFNRK